MFGILPTTISMDFMGGLPITRKGHDYLFVVLDMFNKRYILMHYKNTIKGTKVTIFFFLSSVCELWDTKEHHRIQGYHIYQYILYYLAREDGH
jgi:hypothetical protein